MNSFEPFGYGTHLILDGFRADAGQLADAGALEAVLRDLGELLNEGGDVTTVSVAAAEDGDDGFSVALVAAESQLAVHAFAGMAKLSLAAFSTRALPSDAITRSFVERFRVGRYECRVHGRSRLLPRDRDALEHALRGERDYARLRLRDLLRS